MQVVESNILATLHFIATQPYMLWSLFTDTPVSIWVKLSHEQFQKLENQFPYTFVIPELSRFNSYFLRLWDYFQILDMALCFFSIFDNMSLSNDSCQAAQSWVTSTAIGSLENCKLSKPFSASFLLIFNRGPVVCFLLQVKILRFLVAITE